MLGGKLVRKTFEDTVTATHLFNQTADDQFKRGLMALTEIKDLLAKYSLLFQVCVIQVKCQLSIINPIIHVSML